MHIKHLVGALLLASSITPALAADMTGKELAFTTSKGNCLACHNIVGGEQPGTLGPELSQMKERYPDKSLLAARIADETQFNPYTPMPPFLKHGTLTKEEFDKVVDFIHGL